MRQSRRRALRRALSGLWLAPLALAGIGGGPRASERDIDGLRLLVLDEAGCPWCERWEDEVGGVYALTDEGRRAPLLRASIHDPLPDGVRLARRAHYTPTFVLLDHGAEVGRIEGYPGEDFFYGLLQRLLARTVSGTQTSG